MNKGLKEHYNETDEDFIHQYCLNPEKYLDLVNQYRKDYRKIQRVQEEYKTMKSDLYHQFSLLNHVFHQFSHQLEIGHIEEKHIYEHMEGYHFQLAHLKKYYESQSVYYLEIGIYDITKEEIENEFIPILEESGLIIPAGRWILRQAVACCKKWQEFIPEFKVNVNLSYVQIIKSKILDEIKQALKDFNLKPALLGIEVTESGYLENTYHYKKLWSSLKEEGITLILDDYGTGYSNAYRLSDLTPHYIKIDRVLTQKALSSNYERSILIYIIEMAHSLKLNVCIEGVETEEELQEIKKLNPDYIQGYLFGKPAPEDEFYNRQIKKK